MKKTWLILLCILSLNLINVWGVEISGEEDMENKWTLFVNNTEIVYGNKVIEENNEIWIPFRTLFESLGSEVIWEESTGNIYFAYAEEKYICKFIALNGYFPEEISILICKEENEDSKYNADYIQLNPWASDGTFVLIEDRTYLSQQTAEYLLKALGCSMEFDTEENIVKVIGGR